MKVRNRTVVCTLQSNKFALNFHIEENAIRYGKPMLTLWSYKHAATPVMLFLPVSLFPNTYGNTYGRTHETK